MKTHKENKPLKTMMKMVEEKQDDHALYEYAVAWLANYWNNELNKINKQ